MILTRILLDTCVVRNFVHTIGPKLDDVALRRRLWKYRISIADSADAELLEQLTDLPVRIDFDEWQRKARELGSLLDPKWPSFVGGRELSALAKSQTDLTIDLPNSQIYHQNYWKLLSNSGSRDQLLAGIKYRDASGRQIELRPNPAHIKTCLDNKRTTWIDFINKMKLHLGKKGDPKSILEAIESDMRTDLCSGSSDPLDLAKRLDGVIRIQMQFVQMALTSNTPYNPESKGRHGDLFDMALLYALPLPAIIVTSDEKFRKRLEATKAPDAGQVLLVDEFNKHARDDTLEGLLTHHRHPDLQARQWREAAYFSWIGRGQPANDEWTDWFLAEPIA